MKLLSVLIFTFAMTMSAQALQVRPGYYYGNRVPVAPQCGYAYFNNWGQCVQTCQQARWTPVYGNQWGWVPVRHPYGGVQWQWRLVNRQWWQYVMVPVTVASNRCFY